MSWARVAGIGSVVFTGAAVAAGMRMWSADLDRAFAEAALEIRQATGLDVAVADGFALDLSWPPRAVADKLTIANPTSAARSPMAVAQRVEAELDILPLLAGEVRPRRVVFKGVDLLLERDRHGLGNWTAVPAESRRALPAEWTAVTSSVVELSIEMARVSFADHATKKKRTISFARLIARAEDREQPIEIEADARINGASMALAGTLGSIGQINSGRPFAVDLTAAGAGAAIAVNGRVAWPAKSAPAATGLAMTIEGADLSDLGPMLDMPLPPVGPYRLSAILGAERTGYRLSALKLRLGRSDLSGEVFVEVEGGRSRLTATLTSALVDLADLHSSPRRDAATPRFDRDPLSADLPPGSVMSELAEAQIHFSGAKVVGGRFDLDRVTADSTLRNARLAAESSNPGGGNARSSLLADGVDGDIRFASEAGSVDPDLARSWLSDQATLLVAETGSGIEFNCMAGHIALAAGMPMTATAVIDAPAATITGVGRVDLRKRTIEMHLTPSTKREDLAGRLVPVIARGPLTEVLIDPLPSAGRTDRVIDAVPPVGDAASGTCMARLDLLAAPHGAQDLAAPAAADRKRAAGAPTRTAGKRSGTRRSQGFLEALSDDISAFLGSAGKPTRPTPIIKRESKKLR